MWISDTNHPAIKASGMRSGYHTVAQFKDKCGVNPMSYPAFFQVSRTGLVCCLPAFREMCERHFAIVRNNYALLGIG